MKDKEIGFAVVKTQDERLRIYECPPYRLDVGNEVMVQSELAPYVLRGHILAVIGSIQASMVYSFLKTLNHDKPFNKVLRKVTYTEYEYPEEAEEQTEESEVEANG